MDSHLRLFCNIDLREVAMSSDLYTVVAIGIVCADSLAVLSQAPYVFYRQENCKSIGTFHTTTSKVLSFCIMQVSPKSNNNNVNMARHFVKCPNH